MKKRYTLIPAALLSAMIWQCALATDTEAAQGHVDLARALAGQQFEHSLFLCDPDGIKTVVVAAVEGSGHWLPPTRVFDDFYYVGNEFVGVWVLRTSAGLILFDATGSMADARDHLIPGLKALGLDPASIRDVVVTHGHWDHYGGAKYLQDTFGSRIALSAEDWTLMNDMSVGSIERAPTFGADRSDRPPPHKDIVVHDGQKLTLGHTTVRLFVTPGHTPGTLSALIPVHEGGKQYLISLLGGTAFPRTLEPTREMGGLLAFSTSVERLSKLSQAAGAVGVINTHIFVDGSLERLREAHVRQGGQPNSFLLGTNAVVRYYGMFDECLKAAAERPLTPMDIKALSQSAEH
jgi:metallo-beta-lactamase class B